MDHLEFHVNFGKIATMAVLSLLGTAAARGRSRRDVVTGFRVLAYPWFARGVAWLLVLVSAALCVVAVAIRHSAGAPAWLGTMSFVMLIGSIAIVVEFTKVRVAWTEYELVLTSPWTGEKRVRWADVERVAYSKTNRWFVVKSNRGVTIRVSDVLGGIAEFVREMQDRLPEAVYRDAAFGITLRAPEQN